MKISEEALAKIIHCQRRASVIGQKVLELFGGNDPLDEVSGMLGDVLFELAGEVVDEWKDSVVCRLLASNLTDREAAGYLLAREEAINALAALNMKPYFPTAEEKARLDSNPLQYRAPEGTVAACRSDSEQG